MDDIDKRIIGELKRDARISNVDLAKRVDLSPTPCLRRVKKLEESGVIRRYEAVLSPRAMGYEISALAFVRLTKKSLDIAEEFEREVGQLDAVTECSVITGANDYLLKIVARNLREYELVLRRDLGKMAAVADIESTIVLKQVECRGLDFSAYLEDQ